MFRFIQQIQQLQPNLIVNAFCANILPHRLIEIPPLGAINIHPGQLPKYRGRFPVPWHILNGEKEFSITIHYINEKIDAGDILVQENYPINPEETGRQLNERAIRLGSQLFIKHFKDIQSKNIKSYPQVGYGSYYNKIPHWYEVDWHHSR